MKLHEITRNYTKLVQSTEFFIDGLMNLRARANEFRAWKLRKLVAAIPQTSESLKTQTISLRM